MASPREILRSVRQVEIRSRRLVTDALVGSYHSVFKGRGMDFEEVREYQPGDDVRTLDWNVTARMDRPFVKVFREERELTLILAVDVSASGRFGSAETTKRERAAELAAVLALSAVRNQDKVGLLLFSDRIERWLPPRKGRPHVLRVVRDMLFHEPEGRGTELAPALDHLGRIQRRRAIVFLLSDFLVPELEPGAREDSPESLRLRRALRVCGRRHDLVAARLVDPREEALPDLGPLVLEDAETGDLVELDARDPEVRRLYAAGARLRSDHLHRLLRESRVDAITIPTEGPYLPALRRFFTQRVARIASNAPR